jgi:zinc transporter ZupT
MSPVCGTHGKHTKEGLSHWAAFVLGVMKIFNDSCTPFVPNVNLGSGGPSFGDHLCAGKVVLGSSFFFVCCLFCDHCLLLLQQVEEFEVQENGLMSRVVALETILSIRTGLAHTPNV